MGYGIQLYSLRDLAEKDLEGALRVVSEMGFTSVEFAGFFGHSAEEVRAMLDTYHLTVAGSHSAMSDLVNNFEETVRYHKTIGNARYIIPWHQLDTRLTLDAFLVQCKEIIPRLQAEGISLGYHNHAHEFGLTEEGYQIHRELERQSALFFELDTYWCYNAGQDPVETMRRLQTRVPCIHLKDGDREGHGCSLGSGTAPVAAVCAEAKKLGMDIIVESEGLQPTGVEEVRRCMEYLKTVD